MIIYLKLHYFIKDYDLKSTVSYGMFLKRMIKNYKRISFCSAYVENFEMRKKILQLVNNKIL